jgi:hypothetical protein
MPSLTTPLHANDYDPRWFVWTIVFLVATGISLVSYIMLSDDGTKDYAEVPAKTATTKVQ